MREDFCAFILTHGRPHKVHTYRTLKNYGYTGRVFIVIDDEDADGGEYRRIYGQDVLVFSKDEVGKHMDQFDNSTDRRSITWARNACWDLAKQEGYRYFIQLDDDYNAWSYRRWGKHHRLSLSGKDEYHSWAMRSLDAVFEALVRLVETTPVTTICLSQGGDHIGGSPRKERFKRKAMNSFVCDTAKPFMFRGRLNQDVTTYVSLGRIGYLFFTDMSIYLSQHTTQGNSGGLTEYYLETGTYSKSFYTVMAAPSCTTVRLMGPVNQRLHHNINWKMAVPLIIPQRIKKAGEV